MGYPADYGVLTVFRGCTGFDGVFAFLARTANGRADRGALPIRSGRVLGYRGVHLSVAGTLRADHGGRAIAQIGGQVSKKKAGRNGSSTETEQTETICEHANAGVAKLFSPMKIIFFLS